MRTARSSLGLLLVCVVACSSHKDSTPSAAVSLDSPGDPLTPPAPSVVAQNITLDEVAVFQGLKVSLAKGGQLADRGSPKMPIVSGRDAVVRLYVTPGSDWSPHDVTARLKITTHTPTGTLSRIFSTTKTIDKASTDDSMDSTINIPLPGSALLTGATFAVVLNEDKGSAAQDADPARFPQDGSFADMAVSGGGTVKVVIVPVKYNADGSGRVPETGDDMIKAYSDHFYRLYPAAKIDIQVRDPYDWGSIIGASGAGFPQVLMAMGGLRASDGVDPDVYYYGAFEPSGSFNAFCGGGCVTGLSEVGGPFSVGIGFPGDETTLTAVHEVGHAHGLKHAPCGGAANPDPAFPYPDGSDGVWSLDPLDVTKLYAPSTKDMMGYCPAPNWISDYHYKKLFVRVESDNHLVAAARIGNTKYRPMYVSDTGEATWGSWTETHWPARGEARVATFEGFDGRTIATDDAFYFPFDHLPGGIVMVPERAEAFASVHVADLVRASAPPALPARAPR
jgi:hypothetical protein